MRARLLAGLALFAATGAGAQPLPVDALFCNIECDSASPQSECRMDLVDGLVIQGKRTDIFALATDDGVELRGEHSIPLADGSRIVLAEAALVLRYSQPGPTACQAGFDIVRGEVLLPLPGGGALSGSALEVIEQPMASMGIDLGRNLIPSDSPWCLPEFGIDCECDSFCLDAVPILRSDRHYLFFDIDSRYVFAIDGFELPSTPGVAATFVLDPLDPYFFLTGSAPAIPGLPAPFGASAGGFGFSWNDEMPFVPLATWPFGPAMQPFRGGYAAHLTLPIMKTEDGKFSVILDGMLIASLDPDEDDDHPFLTPEAFLADPDLALGANGAFDLEFKPFAKKNPNAKPAKSKPGKPAKPLTPKDTQKEGKKAGSGGNGLLSITVDLGAASAIGRVHPDFTELFLSGSVGNQKGLLPAYMPLPVTAGAGVKLGAYLTTQGDASFVRAEGGFGIDTSVLAEWAKLEALSAVNTTNAFLMVDKTGFRIGGETTAQLHPLIAPAGTLGVEAFIAPNGIDSSLTLRGDMAFADDPYQDTELTLSPRGLRFAGTLVFANTEFDMVGTIGKGTGTLTGSSNLAIHYEREDTIRKLQLLDLILNQSEVVAAGEVVLHEAERVLEIHVGNAEAAQRDLAIAVTDVNRLQGNINAIDVTLAQLRSDLNFQANVRNCAVDYTGCVTCGSCTSRCSCGTIDPVCWADCGVCQTARTTCLGVRETCRIANAAPCELDRAARIVALAAQIAAQETAKAAVIVAKDVALAALALAQTANQIALGIVATAENTVEAARVGLDAAQAVLAEYRDELEHLPDVEGDIDAQVSLTISNGPRGKQKAGRVTATFEGIPIAKGRMDFGTNPPRACVTVPVPTLGELCAPL